MYMNSPLDQWHRVARLHNSPRWKLLLEAMTSSRYFPILGYLILFPDSLLANVAKAIKEYTMVSSSFSSSDFFFCISRHPREHEGNAQNKSQGRQIGNVIDMTVSTQLWSVIDRRNSLSCNRLNRDIKIMQFRKQYAMEDVWSDWLLFVHALYWLVHNLNHNKVNHLHKRHSQHVSAQKIYTSQRIRSVPHERNVHSLIFKPKGSSDKEPRVIRITQISRCYGVAKIRFPIWLLVRKSSVSKII